MNAKKWDVSELFGAMTCGVELVHPFYALDYPLFLTDRSVLGGTNCRTVLAAE